MTDFYKKAAVIGISLSIVSVPTALISTVSCFKLARDCSKLARDCSKLARPFGGSVNIVGMMFAPSIAGGGGDHMYLIPRTDCLYIAGLSMLCLWEHTNGTFGRALPSFFPVYDDGCTDLTTVIGFCYDKRELPDGSFLLYADKNFVYDRTPGGKHGVYVYAVKVSPDDYPKSSHIGTYIQLLPRRGCDQSGAEPLVESVQEPIVLHRQLSEFTSLLFFSLDPHNLVVENDRFGTYDVSRFYSNLMRVDGSIAWEDVDMSLFLPWNGGFVVPYAESPIVEKVEEQSIEVS